MILHWCFDGYESLTIAYVCHGNVFTIAFVYNWLQNFKMKTALDTYTVVDNFTPTGWAFGWAVEFNSTLGLNLGYFNSISILLFYYHLKLSVALYCFFNR